MTFSLSNSTLKILDECPLCFWLHFNKKIKRPQGIFPSLPNGIDIALKAHFDSFQGSPGILPPELEGVEKNTELFSDLDLLKTWQNNRQGLRWQDRAGNIISGILDYVLVNKSKLIVLDFKTRGFPLKDNTSHFYQDQIDIYTFLLKKAGFKTEDYGYLLFIYPDKFSADGTFLWNSDLVKLEASPSNAEQRIMNALTILAGAKPEPSPECPYCIYRNQTI